MRWRRKVLQELKLIHEEVRAIRVHLADLDAFAQDMRRQLDVGRLEEAAADLEAVQEMARTRGLPPYLGEIVRKCPQAEMVWPAQTNATPVPEFFEVEE